MSFWKALFGLASVKYDPITDMYTIEGVSRLEENLRRFFGDNPVNNIFKKISKTSVTFNSVFLYEVVHMLDYIISKPRYGGIAKQANKLIEDVSKIKEEHIQKEISKYELDLTLLKNMKYKPFKYQEELLKSYGRYKADTGYRGYLLDMGVGLGKSISSLWIAECVRSTKTIIVCPLNTVYKVWVKTIENDLLADGQPKRTYWVSKENKPYNDEQYIIVHYEDLYKLDNILQQVASSTLSFIVDESHNFADTKSKRSTLLIEMVDKSLTENLILLSGTPIKAYSVEIVNLLRLVDKRIKGDIYNRIYKVYAKPSLFFKSILPGRYKLLSYKVEKQEANELKPIIKQYLPVKLANGNLYTIEKIRRDMQEYLEKRSKEIEDALPMYKETFENGLRIVEEYGFKDVSKYKKLVVTINNSYLRKELYLIPSILAEAKKLEKEISSYLDRSHKESWLESAVIMKYPMLKIVGECLGRIILRARINCHMDIARAIEYDKIIESTHKDTIIFSNYVEVCNATKEVLITKYKTSPVCVYGSNVKNLNTEVSRFANDPNANPLIATYKSLSTGVPLTNANIILAMDLPYRMYIFEQAVGRAWRTGQDSQVIVYMPSLDTGDQPNINQRNFDIITFFKSEVETITGRLGSLDLGETTNLESITQEFLYDIKNFEVDKSLYSNINLESIDIKYNYYHKVLNW